MSWEGRPLGVAGGPRVQVDAAVDTRDAPPHAGARRRRRPCASCKRGRTRCESDGMSLYVCVGSHTGPAWPGSPRYRPSMGLARPIPFHAPRAIGSAGAFLICPMPMPAPLTGSFPSSPPNICRRIKLSLRKVGWPPWGPRWVGVAHAWACLPFPLPAPRSHAPLLAANTFTQVLRVRRPLLGY